MVDGSLFHSLGAAIEKARTLCCQWENIGFQRDEAHFAVDKMKRTSTLEK